MLRPIFTLGPHPLDLIVNYSTPGREEKEIHNENKQKQEEISEKEEATHSMKFKPRSYQNIVASQGRANREKVIFIVSLNSCGMDTSSQMLIRIQCSASRALRPAPLKCSPGIPPAPGALPELIMLMAHTNFSGVGDKSRSEIVGFGTTASYAEESTVDGMFIRLEKCSFHL
ncbi:hypothetical protein CHS0354_032100 [Potamilus streckersoni]|uniref:Uncharacterized protein n=1 Tax=Potamilus streckersoni TaxID=2493646 RepID=A0AAE0VF44_9BIVA|nr:hypothetical protein CHS0354_032100 [Potamilus streckersoni]